MRSSLYALKPEQLVQIINMVADGTINATQGKILIDYYHKIFQIRHGIQVENNINWLIEKGFIDAQ